LSTGTPAPDFQLPVTPHRTVALSDFRGQPVILAFYPADWGPVSRDQIALYQAKLPMVRQFGAELIGISVDGICSHQEFARQLGLEFPLLADFEPKGSVARTYGVYRTEVGRSARALFVLDCAGIIVWSYQSPDEVNPGVDGILAALERTTERRRTSPPRAHPPR